MRRMIPRVFVLATVLVILSTITTGMLLAGGQLNLVPTVPSVAIVGTVVQTLEPNATLPAPTATIPWYVDLPPTERAVEELKESIRQSDIQTVTAMSLLGITPPPLPTLGISGSGVSPITNGRHPAGIGDIIELRLYTPFQKSFQVRNIWTAPLESVQVIVYAGFNRPNADQGGVFVQWGEIGALHPTRNSQYYAAPEGIGPLRVVGATGTVLTLTTDDGMQVQFDVLTGIFVGSSGVPGPTITITAEPYPPPVTTVPTNPAPVTVVPVSTAIVTQ